MTVRQVIKSYQRYYPDPISLVAGERVRVTKQDLWDGVHSWLWCINDAGKEGWTPEAYLSRHGEYATCTQAYSAWELSVTEGDVLQTLKSESGWFWCENAQGEQGWVPENCFAPE